MRDERVFSVVNEPQSLSIELKCWTWNIINQPYELNLPRGLKKLKCIYSSVQSSPVCEFNRGLWFDPTLLPPLQLSQAGIVQYWPHTHTHTPFDEISMAYNKAYYKVMTLKCLSVSCCVVCLSSVYPGSR